MEHKKAKKAVKMAEKAMEMMELEDAIEEMAKPDLQPADGEINPMMAVMGGQIKITGDMGLAMKVQSLIG